MDKFVGRGTNSTDVYFKYGDGFSKRKNSIQAFTKKEPTKDSLNDSKTRNEDSKPKNNDNNRPLSVSSGIDIHEAKLEPIQAVENLVEAQASNFRLTVTAMVFAILTILLITGLVTFFVLYYSVLVKSPTFKETCSTDKPCVENKSLICNGSCSCEAANYWDGFKCTQLLSFGSTCYGGSFQCLTGLSCINTICQCQNSSYYDGKCLSKLSYGSICSSCNYTSCPGCISCNQCQDYSNLQCNLTTSRCICPFSTHYYDSSTQLCHSKQSLSIYCTRDTECQDVTRGLYCQTSYPLGTSCPTQPAINFCNCPSNTYYNGSMCMSLELYSATCTQTCNCDSTRGLYCDLVEKKCLCPENYYWDSNVLFCYKQFNYNVACTSNKQCDSSKGLTCNGTSCDCKLFPGNWYWSSMGRYCVECPYDWTIISSGINQKCVKVFHHLISTWMEAQTACEDHHSHLVVLNDSVLSSQTKALVLQAGYYYVGATDSKTDGAFTWAYDDEAIDITIVPKCANEFGGGLNENCLMVRAFTWCYADICCSCSWKSMFICQRSL
jgi:hypothetical protein